MKHVVVSITDGGRESVLATVDSLSEALREQKRRLKMLPDTTSVMVQEKSQYLMVKNHNRKLKDKQNAKS